MSLGDAELRLQQLHLLTVRDRVDLDEQLARGDHVLFLNQEAGEVAGHFLRADVDEMRLNESIVGDRMSEPMDGPVHGKRCDRQHDQDGHHEQAPQRLPHTSWRNRRAGIDPCGDCESC